MTRPYIRLAVEEDIPAVMDLLTAFHAESGIAPLVSAKVERSVRALTEALDLFIAEQDGELIGTLGLVESVLWYSDGHVLGAHFFFVRAEHRGGPAGQMLLRAATLEAERRNLPLFILTINPRKAGRGRTATVDGYFPAGFETRFR